MKRCYSTHQIGNAAKIIGVDVARFGDDESALAFRQGILAFPFQTYRNIDSTYGAGLVARAWDDFGAHACFVDDTGGFGSGWIDGLKRLGKSPVGIGFASKPNDGRYFNKRAEMAFECVQWIRRGGALQKRQSGDRFDPDELHVSRRQAVARAEGGPQGPDWLLADEFDALILTFAQPVMVPDFRPRFKMAVEYNPYAEEGANRPSNFSYDYNPFE